MRLNSINLFWNFLCFTKSEAWLLGLLCFNTARFPSNYRYSKSMYRKVRGKK